MSDDQTGIVTIGAYQLRNLISNGVRFFYYDLSAQKPESNAPPALVALLASSRWIKSEDLASTLAADGATSNAPIVLICENGANSMAAARELARHSFINVFVVEGGTQALSAPN